MGPPTKKMGACSATEGSPQLDCEFPTEVSYFGLKTPVFLPTLLLLELGGADYKVQVIKNEDWPAMKKTTPGGKLPFAKFNDGEILTESGAIGRTIAGAAGLLYSGRDYAQSERLVGMTADMNKKVAGLIPTVFTWGAETLETCDLKQAAWEAEKAACIAEVDRFATFLQGDKKDRFTDKGDLFGEVDLFAKLNCYATSVFPEAATGTLKAFYDRFMDMEAVKKVLNDHFMVMLGDASYKGQLGEYMVGPGVFGIHTPEEEAAIAERAAAAAEEKEAAFLESLSDLDRLQYRIETAKAAEAEAAEAEAAAAKAEAEAEKKP